MRRFSIVCLFCLIAAIGQAQQNTLEDTLTWGNVTPQQVEQLVGMAERGHAAALYYVGRCYFNGYCLPKDKFKAVEYLGRAADKDQPEALYLLGQCYNYGLGVVKNEAKARELFQRAVKWFEQDIEENSYAPYYLAQCYNYGFGVPTDTGKSISLLEKAGNMGNTQALVDLAMAY